MAQHSVSVFLFDPLGLHVESIFSLITNERDTKKTRSYQEIFRRTWLSSSENKAIVEIKLTEGRKYVDESDCVEEQAI